MTTPEIGTDEWYATLDEQSRKGIDMVRDVWRKARNSIGPDSMALDVLLGDLADKAGVTREQMARLLDADNPETGDEKLGVDDFARLDARRRLNVIRDMLASIRFEMPRYKYTHLCTAEAGASISTTVLSVAAFFARKQGYRGRSRYWNALAGVNASTALAIRFVLSHADINDSIDNVKPVIDPTRVVLAP